MSESARPKREINGSIVPAENVEPAFFTKYGGAFGQVDDGREAHSFSVMRVVFTKQSDGSLRGIDEVGIGSIPMMNSHNSVVLFEERKVTFIMQDPQRDSIRWYRVSIANPLQFGSSSIYPVPDDVELGAQMLPVSV